MGDHSGTLFNIDVQEEELNSYQKRSATPTLIGSQVGNDTTQTLRQIGSGFLYRKQMNRLTKQPAEKRIFANMPISSSKAVPLKPN